MILPKRVTNILLTTAVCIVGIVFPFVTEVKAQVTKESSDSVNIRTGERLVPTGDLHESKRKGTTDKMLKNPSLVDSRLQEGGRPQVNDKSDVSSEGKSTLSFNIFLFVLDRFKEDQEANGEKGD